MKIGRVTGTVVSTISAPIFDGRTLLMCDLLDETAADASDYLICVDAVGAGPGEIVLILDEGNGARQIVGSSDGPIRAVVVGILEALVVDGGEIDLTG